MDKTNPDVNVNIYVDLDCILDTRLPVLYAIDEDTATTVIKSGYYQKRVRDTFGIIPTDLFHIYYKLRSKNVLKLATPTPMLELVKEYCIESFTVATTTEDMDIPTLYVNTYPYIMSEEEKNSLLALFYSELTVSMRVEIVHQSIEEITPVQIYNTASTFIKYDILTWLEYHNAIGNLTKCPLLGNVCIGPMLANGDKPTKDMSQDDFDDVRALFGPFTNLVLLQTRLFSVP